ncbi:MAG TPA: beta-galactosidase, partial [Vicinamibacterales bacterium]|nr:beta-galactosidase [Vicinamibacterales bacterium]
MRFAVLAAAATMAASALVPSPRQAEPFVPMAVDYAVDPLTSPSTTAGDLQSIRNLGFNIIATVVRWRDAEPAPGKYSFASLERTLAAAEQAGLRVQVTLDNTAPDWLFDRYPDGRRVTGTQTPASPPENAACFDHPAVRAALQAFLESASRIVSRSPAFFALDAGSPTPVGFCLCPNTARRFAASAKESGLDHDAFVRTSLRDDLKWMISQTAPSYARIVGAHSRVPSLLQRT